MVILAGLLLGGALAHFFGTKAPQKVLPNAVAVVTPPPVMESPEANAPTPLPSLTPVPSPTPVPSATPLSSATPLASPTAKPSRRPPAVAIASATPAATPTAIATHVAVVRQLVAPARTPHPPRPLRTHRPMPVATVRVALTPAATPSKSVPTIGDQATSVVRSYLAAMTQGDREAAGAYLASGEPTESFLNGSTAVHYVRSSALGASRYRVTADMRSGGAEYYETFTVEPGPGGLQITDHYWIKPQ